MENVKIIKMLCENCNFAVVVIAITALNVRTVLSSDRSYDMNTSTIEAISGEDDPIDGGEMEMWRLRVAKAVEVENVMRREQR